MNVLHRSAAPAPYVLFRLTVRRVVRFAAAGGLALTVGCGRHEPNPLLADPMADVHLSSATRVQRTITDPSAGSSYSKRTQAVVVEVFRASGPGAPASTVISELVHRSKAAGWVFDPSISGLAELAQRTVQGVPATLTVGPREGAPAEIVLRLTAL